MKASDHVICLFYTKTSQWCQQLAEHLALLAQKHLECKFIKIDADKAPYLLEKLNIYVMPSVLLAKNNKVLLKIRDAKLIEDNGLEN